MSNSNIPAETANPVVNPRVKDAKWLTNEISDAVYEARSLISIIGEVSNLDRPIQANGLQLLADLIETRLENVGQDLGRLHDSLTMIDQYGLGNAKVPVVGTISDAEVKFHEDLKQVMENAAKECEQALNAALNGDDDEDLPQAA